MPRVRPPVDPSLDLEAEIMRLKRERNAVILAHYYQDSEIQDLADYVGDSLAALAQAAEDAGRRDRVLRRPLHGRDREDPEPRRRSSCPDLDAGCSLADGCPRRPFAAWLAQYPGHKVVCYINCSADGEGTVDSSARRRTR